MQDGNYILRYLSSSTRNFLQQCVSSSSGKSPHDKNTAETLTNRTNKEKGVNREKWKKKLFSLILYS